MKMDVIEISLVNGKYISGKYNGKNFSLDKPEKRLFSTCALEIAYKGRDYRIVSDKAKLNKFSEIERKLVYELNEGY